VGESPKFVAVLKTIERVAQTASNVLISGESGTGKEVLARAIHYGGPRKDRPFVAVNCGGLAESLVESELFGYRRGAFTGANADRTGYFEAAEGGTLFLDEISTLPYKSQATLLRAIEERAVTRVGDNRPRPVNIRIIAATNRDLEEAIDREEFRQDLYFRLNVIGITIPPLRERREDIPLLIDHFVERYNVELNCRCPGFTPHAVEAMIQQRWRGNVRELENVVERALIFSDDRVVDVQDLVGAIEIPATIPTPSATNLRTALREFERQHIQNILTHNGNNKVAAAEKLGIGLSSLYRKMEELSFGKTDAEKEQTA
jgi:transcriptional regulator with PAS, ATPase and Fis domain